MILFETPLKLSRNRSSEVTQGVGQLAAKPDNQSSFSRAPWWNERTNFWQLFSDLYTHSTNKSKKVT